MATASCSHWWHCPIYFAMSVTLAAIAISASRHSKPHNATTLNPLNRTIIPHSLSSNASHALRKHGFNAIATLLQIYPEHFFSTPQSTIFAIQDPAIAQIAAHPQLMKQLLRYHTSPSKIPFQELLKKPQGTCFPTLVHPKRIGITKTDAKRSVIEINNMLISHPDIFLEGPISIHGVLGAFASFDFKGNNDQEWEITQTPICDGKFSNTRNVGEWTRMSRFLSSNRYMSFAVGLNSVLDGILQDHPELINATIFAPLDFAFVSSSRALLDGIVRYHIVPQRFTHMELASLPEKSTLKTLVFDRNLVITKSGYTEQKRAINGVVLSSPNAFLSQHLVIHGISRALRMKELPSTSL